MGPRRLKGSAAIFSWTEAGIPASRATQHSNGSHSRRGRKEPTFEQRLRDVAFLIEAYLITGGSNVVTLDLGV